MGNVEGLLWEGRLIGVPSYRKVAQGAECMLLFIQKRLVSLSVDARCALKLFLVMVQEGKLW